MHRKFMRPSRTLIAALTFGVLLVGACGDDGEDDSIPMSGNRPTTTVDDPTEATFPTTVPTANGPIEIPEQPQHIVSLSPTATEMVFAIDAGSQVAAVDEQSDFPAEVPVTDLSGSEPDAEAIAGYQPDLVLVQDDAALPELDSLSAPVLLLPPARDLDQTYAQIEQLGQATGHPGEALELVETMRSEIQAMLEDADQSGTPASVYHEVDTTPRTVTANSFLGGLYEMAGLDNVGPATDGTETGVVPISPEQVVDANPDWIFVAYPGDTALTDLESRPGWDQITAVRDDQVVALDPDIASRWGPRTVELLRTIIDSTAS
jgi:iron complex transport system substrate-binding protein